MGATLTLKPHLTSDQCININKWIENETHSSPLLSPLTQTLSRAQDPPCAWNEDVIQLRMVIWTLTSVSAPNQSLSVSWFALL